MSGGHRCEATAPTETAVERWLDFVETEGLLLKQKPTIQIGFPKQSPSLATLDSPLYTRGPYYQLIKDPHKPRFVRLKSNKPGKSRKIKLLPSLLLSQLIRLFGNCFLTAPILFNLLYQIPYSQICAPFGNRGSACRKIHRRLSLPAHCEHAGTSAIPSKGS